MDKEKQEVHSDTEKIIVEEAFERLAEINAQLENQETGLKESLALYAEGVKLVAACKESLEGVEKEIQILNEI